MKPNAEIDTVIDTTFTWLWAKFNGDITEKASNKIRQKWELFDFQSAARKYADQIREQYGTMQIWRMVKPTPLEDIFTNVNILDKPSAFQRKPKDQLEKMFLIEGSFGTVIEPEKGGIEAVYDHNRLFILGKPGSGKTTFLKYITLQSLTKELDRIPVFISLKNFSESGISLNEYIVEQFDICNFPDAVPFIETILRKVRHFKLTDYSLKQLGSESEKIPKDILRNLRSIKGQVFYSQNEYLKALRKTVGTNQYKRLILKQIESDGNRIFIIRENLFFPLWDEVITNLEILQKQEYSTQSDFMEGLSTIMSADEFQALLPPIISKSENRFIGIFGVKSFVEQIEQIVDNNFEAFISMGKRTSIKGFRKDLETKVIPECLSLILNSIDSEKGKIFQITSEDAHKLTEIITKDSLAAITRLQEQEFNNENELIQAVKSAIKKAESDIVKSGSILWRQGRKFRVTQKVFDEIKVMGVGSGRALKEIEKLKKQVYPNEKALITDVKKLLKDDYDNILSSFQFKDSTIIFKITDDLLTQLRDQISEEYSLRGIKRLQSRSFKSKSDMLKAIKKVVATPEFKLIESSNISWEKGQLFKVTQQSLKDIKMGMYDFEPITKNFKRLRGQEYTDHQSFIADVREILEDEQDQAFSTLRFTGDAIFFKLTDELVRQIKDEISKKNSNMRNELKDKVFASQEEFITSIAEALGTSEYESLILNYLKARRYKIFRIADSVGIETVQTVRRKITDELKQLKEQSYLNLKHFRAALEHVSFTGLKDLTLHYVKLKHRRIFQIRQECILKVKERLDKAFRKLNNLNKKAYSGKESLLANIDELLPLSSFKNFVLDRIEQESEIFTITSEVLLGWKENLPKDLSTKLDSLSIDKGYSNKGELIRHLNHLIGRIRFKSLILKFTQKRRPLILFDGLDEVGKENGLRKKTIQELIKFGRKYNNSQIIITCRVAAQDYFFPNFTYVEIADFNNEQVKSFVDKWFSQSPKEGKDFFNEFGKNAHNKRLYELARNPLLLTLLCIAFKETLSFPVRRAEIYEEALDALLKKWDASRGIKRDEIYHNLSLGRKRQMFATIAMTTFENKEYLFAKKRLGELISVYLRSLPKTDGINPQNIDTFTEPELPFTLHENIVDFLTSLPNVHDSNALRALVYNAGLDAQLQSQINFSLPPAQFFQIHISLLSKYGSLKDGRNAVKAILESAKAYVGQQGKERCDTIIQRLVSALNNDSTNVSQSVNKPDIDSDAIIEEIEAQHGIFIERAQNIYSFSHLTFQEYYAAKYIIDDVTGYALETSISSYFDEESWREIFLLTAEMLANADPFFDIFIVRTSESIRKFKRLLWVLNRIHIISEVFSPRLKPLVTKIATWGLITSAALDLIEYVGEIDPFLADKIAIIDWKSRDDYEKVRALNIALHITNSQILKERCSSADIEYLDIAIAEAGFYTVKMMIAGSNIFFQDSLFGLKDAPSKGATPEEWGRFTNYMFTAVNRKSGNTIKSVGLTKSQYSHIRDYMKSTKLLLECLDIAYVTDRSRIEDNLLSPLSL